MDYFFEILELSKFVFLELRKWSDAMLIAPLDANSMGKIANGICDNILLSIVRAWDPRKPLYYAPAMNVAMWENPLTYQHRKVLKELLRYKVDIFPNDSFIWYQNYFGFLVLICKLVS